MPARAGIQREQSPASSYFPWIPAFAGMTNLRHRDQSQTDKAPRKRVRFPFLPRFSASPSPRFPVSPILRFSLQIFSFSLLLLFSVLPAFALETPQQVEAFDMPSDSGGAIGLRWAATPTDDAKASYRILFSDRRDGDFVQVTEFPAHTRYETEAPGPWWMWPGKRADRHFFHLKSSSQIPLTNDTRYFFKVVMVQEQDSAESAIVSAIPQADLFNWTKLNNLLLMLSFGGIVLFSIRRARINPHIFLRRIPGLDAVEEAVGRATEMGRPVLYLTGSGELGGGGDPSSLATIAATVILGEVAKRVAAYGADLKVPHRAPIVMAICQEIVRESYLAAGRPDAYKEDANFFITRDQFAYTAAVDGMMLREKPAANFFMGYYYAESLLLAETGAATGAIQIAGTDAEHQLPFFVTACDYTLIGEELYAASAYLSREPALVGTLRAQDIGKGVLLGAMLAGALFLTLGEILNTSFFRLAFQIFHDFK